LHFVVLTVNSILQLQNRKRVNYGGLRDDTQLKSMVTIVIQISVLTFTLL